MNTMENQMNKSIIAEQEKKAKLEEYLKSLSDKDIMAYHIAISHLQSSFQLEKSNGFLQWKQQQQKLSKL